MQLTERIRFEPEPTRGSRFVATAVPVSDEAAAKAALAELRAQMPDATHHCSAWRIAAPSLERASDDGEPGGSAGRPILAQIQGRNLVNTAVIVTRYYGGTKLGVGGLVRAYGAAAAAALDAGTIEPYVTKTALRIVHAYAASDAVERALGEAGAVQTSIHYGTDVRREIEVPTDRADALTERLRDATRGGAQIGRPD